ncbi:uncharacterized protein LOC119302831 [Triticum dicoccoides]|uniref:Uncharacterized protein n=2 Tax=Triticum TaxID=4564 RepID=A0A9R0QP43_TRITD|nr:uncharacterized protein LOC119302831 [Triticum dicoccoides]XP_044365845.1 uncharacterized protein LOC123087797 [Triticum aestivum]VAH14073.1 unnamed protein product [Triticum turgidum subsp. durum]
MEWTPKQQALGGLGLAGVCRETCHVIHRAMLPNFVNLGPPLLSALLLASSAAVRALCSRVLADLHDHDGPSLLCLVTDRLAFFLFVAVSIGLVLLLLLLCAAAYLFCVVSLYSTGGDLRAADRVLRGFPTVPLTRFVCTFLLAAVPFFVICTSLFVAALFQPQEPLGAADKIMLPLQLLGWAAFLASAAYVAVVCQLACVVSLLEDAVLFGALRKSRALVVGKFWAAAGVFVTLDGCIFAVLVAFPVLVVDDALGLGLGFQVAAGVAMAVALCAVVLLTLVAQPVVYLVCKNHHHLVVDKVHLD